MTVFRSFALIFWTFWATTSELKDPPNKIDGFLVFLREHYLPNFVSLEAVSCNSLMRASFSNEVECKEVNTYIVSFPDLLQNVCQSKGKPYYSNLRRSLEYFDLITCTLEGDPTEEFCEYSLHRFSGTIAVSCDKYGYPVYLEEGDFEIVPGEEEEGSLTWYNYFFSIFD